MTAPVPPDLLAEYEELLARAAAAGRPLDPVPVLVLAATPRQSSYSFVKSGKSGAPPRVRLGQALLDPAYPDRGWTIAHELSHHVRHQDGSRVVPSNGYEAATAAVGLLAAAVLAGSGFTSHFPFVFVLGVVIVVVMVGMVVAPIRREEGAADVTAAELFREVLSEAGVIRLRRRERAGSRLYPSVIRSHPHPPSRRRAGLAAACRSS